jgi:cephalosporin hydroxylase
MKRLTVDFEAGTVRVEGGEGEGTHALASPAAFEAVSDAWLRAGWDAKYVYSFTWMGRPVIQLPDDMIRIQEVIYRVQPDVIVETGVAHGGSLIYYASLFEAMGRGRVVGVDIEIRPHNRAAIEAHPMSKRIRLIEGSSVEPTVVAAVKETIQPGERVMVLLDALHTKAHVAAELEAYAPLVSEGSYIVAMDGIMGQVAGAPRTQPDWTWNNPVSAVREFIAAHPEFVEEEPPWAFNEGAVRKRVTYWPSAYLRRLGAAAR